MKAYAVSAAPFAGILVALYLSNQVCTLTLTWFAEKANVGYFAAAMRIMDCLVLIPAAIMGSFLPTMSRFYPRSLTSFVQTLRLTLKYLFVISMPLLVILVVLPRQIILFLYGGTFYPAADALMVMGLVLPFSFWNYAATTTLMARNLERSAMRFLWIVAAVHIAANLVFIPGLAHVGACWAIAATQFSYFVILFYSSRRYLNLVHLLRSILPPAFAALMMGIFLYFTKDYNVIVTVSAGMLVYVSILLASGSISRAEIAYFKSWRFA
ncbi:MAG: polysaccharide biosynthesis C-terminal domain-containing protein [Syntrophobacteraceae bacterium]